MPKKILLPRPDPNIHLSSNGYSTKKPSKQRESSLKRASKKYGTLPVLRRLNLIRNITAPQLPAHKVMGKDVAFMKRMYSHERKMSRQQSRKISKKKSKKLSKQSSKKH